MNRMAEERLVCIAKKKSPFGEKSYRKTAEKVERQSYRRRTVDTQTTKRNRKMPTSKNGEKEEEQNLHILEIDETLKDIIVKANLLLLDIFLPNTVQKFRFSQGCGAKY